MPRCHQTLWNVHVVLGSLEDVIPQPGLQMGLQLWDIVVGCCAVGQTEMNVVEEIKSKVHDGPRHGLPITEDVLFV